MTKFNQIVGRHVEQVKSIGKNECMTTRKLRSSYSSFVSSWSPMVVSITCTGATHLPSFPLKLTREAQTQVSA